ncbi:MAG: hypothetical protein JXO44_14615 [Clostridia bacterium]|nr:hypothetical protein [Clostridia bacterium]
MNKLLEILSKPFVWFFSSLKITNNSRSKVLSVVFAIIFWVFVMDQENPEMSKWIINIPVEFKNEQMLLDDGLIVMDTEERLVNVEIKGRRNDVMDVTAADIHVSANLLGYGKGNNSIAIDKTITQDNVVISDISQQDVKVFIDKIIEVKKPVDVAVVGAVQSGYVNDSIIMVPEEVVVKGPETYVNAVASARGEVDISDLTEDTSKEIALHAVDNDGNMVQNVTLAVQYVDVQMGIKKIKTVKILPNVIGEPPAGYKITNVSVEPSEVVLKGHEGIVDNIEALPTSPIDVSDVKETMVFETEVSIPEGISILSFEPPFKVAVEIEPVEERTFEFTTEDILVKDVNGFMTMDSKTAVNEKYTASFGSEVSTIKVVVSDVPKVLSELSAEDFKVYVDLSAYEAGTFTIPIVAEGIDKSLTVEVKPININISLIERENIAE